MTAYYFVLCAHVVGATVWVGGHLLLALRVLPRALRERRAAIVSEFESAFERIGLPALAVQLATGLWLAEHLLGAPSNWFEDAPLARTVQLKLGFVAATIALAVHARLRLIPRLDDDRLPSLAWHIRAVALLAVLLALAGVSVRFGGYPVFDE